VTRRLEYRLASLPGADPLAAAFFAGLYAWVAGQYQDRTSGPLQPVPPSTIGQGSEIMTPDHPDSKPGTKNGREAHRGHMPDAMTPMTPRKASLESRRGRSLPVVDGMGQTLQPRTASDGL
jgi:hypothetical protein